jgi:hypothetical protein
VVSAFPEHNVLCPLGQENLRLQVARSYGRKSISKVGYRKEGVAAQNLINNARDVSFLPGSARSAVVTSVVFCATRDHVGQYDLARMVGV